MASHTKKKRSLAWKIFDAVITLILVIILLFLVINAIMSVVDDTYTPTFFGHQLYTIVTDSMVPTIPVGSLVSAKNFTKQEKANLKRAADIDAMSEISAAEKEELKRSEGLKEIEFGTIIVFNATLSNGKKIIVTHYFNKIENGKVLTYAEQFREKRDENGNYVLDEEGKVIYENVKINSPDDEITHDGYSNTSIDDIRAVYSWHIAGVGKFLLFLKSPPAFIMYAVIAVIIVCGYLLIKRVNRQESVKAEQGEPAEPPSYEGGKDDKDSDVK